MVDAVRCVIEIQSAMIERNAGLQEDLEFRVGLQLVEEEGGDLLGAARVSER